MLMGAHHARVRNGVEDWVGAPLTKARKFPLPDIGAMIEAGQMVRFWSDPHFEHDNIRRLADRNVFLSVEDMDRVLWANLEEAMEQSDFVICLGDMALKKSTFVPTQDCIDF
jgi:hypothetical protein